MIVLFLFRASSNGTPLFMKNFIRYNNNNFDAKSTSSIVNDSYSGCTTYATAWGSSPNSQTIKHVTKVITVVNHNNQWWIDSGVIWQNSVGRPCTMVSHRLVTMNYHGWLWKTWSHNHGWQWPWSVFTWQCAIWQTMIEHGRWQLTMVDHGSSWSTMVHFAGVTRQSYAVVLLINQVLVQYAGVPYKLITMADLLVRNDYISPVWMWPIELLPIARTRCSSPPRSDQISHTTPQTSQQPFKPFISNRYQPSYSAGGQDRR